MRRPSAPAVARPLALVAAVAATGCTDTTRLGDVRVCFAAEDDDDTSAFDRDEARTGLRRSDDDVSAPEAFTACAAGMAESAAFVDGAGARVWLALEANVNARDLVPRGLLDTIDDGTLLLRSGEGFTPFASLVLRDADGLAVALQSSHGLQEGALAPEVRDALAPLVVESAGAAALAVLEACGPQTALRVRFAGDDGARALANGESAGLLLEGREVQATNVHSIDHAGSSCEDAPSGMTTTWIVTDASL